jgi:hypothetical protein
MPKTDAGAERGGGCLLALLLSLVVGGGFCLRGARHMSVRQSSVLIRDFNYESRDVIGANWQD